MGGTLTMAFNDAAFIHIHYQLGIHPPKLLKMIEKLVHRLGSEG